jgi:hypothetical protein
LARGQAAAAPKIVAACGDVDGGPVAVLAFAKMSTRGGWRASVPLSSNS